MHDARQIEHLHVDMLDRMALAMQLGSNGQISADFGFHVLLHIYSQDGLYWPFIDQFGHPTPNNANLHLKFAHSKSFSTPNVGGSNTSQTFGYQHISTKAWLSIPMLVEQPPIPRCSGPEPNLPRTDSLALDTWGSAPQRSATPQCTRGGRAESSNLNLNIWLGINFIH